MPSSDTIQQPLVGIAPHNSGVRDVGDAVLHKAVEARDPSRLRCLLDGGADPDQPDDAGDTALMVACRADLPVEAKLLLDHGADPNYSNRGWTALRYSAKDRNARMVRILLDAGAHIPNRGDAEAWAAELDAFTREVAATERQEKEAT